MLCKVTGAATKSRKASSALATGAMFGHKSLGG